MLTAAQEKQRHQLYAQTVASMGDQLAAVTVPANLFAALGWGLEEMERTYAATPAKVRATAACRAGCAHCCSGPVDVQAHEVFFAAEHIQANFAPADLAGVIERTAVHRAQRQKLGAEARSRLNLPCPLLRDGQCAIYPGRPEACRAHHSNNAAACAAHAADPDFPIDKNYIPALRARLFAVMLGMDEALESAGYDDRSYDFGSALHEALTNSLCLVRWMRRQPAFPESCLTPPLG
ncbi:MAG: YkgJ family cysteine cluster protein [Opitutae bacterium]